MRAFRKFWMVGLLTLAINGLVLAGTPEPVRRVVKFESAELSATSDFEGGRLSDFVAEGPNSYSALIAPEWRPMNNQQAWYAFRLQSPKPRVIEVKLTYTDGKKNLFYPKISRDRTHWQELPKGDFRLSSNSSTATLRLTVGPEPLWVSAQELFTQSDYASWIQKLTEHPYVTSGTIGFSTQQRPIFKMDITEAPADAPLVLVLGRQHPPEVTGGFGLVSFVETVTGDSQLARDFRSKFHILVIPLINPDGVNNGHWRYNVNGTDLNRDWGTFAEKETQAVRDEILRALAAAKNQVLFSIDYHSTTKDVYYPFPTVKSSEPDERLEAKDVLMRKWLERVRQLTPDHRVPIEVSPATRESKLNSVLWMRTFGAASITHEFNHDTDRQVIRQVAQADATALMELLLARNTTSNQPTQ